MAIHPRALCREEHLLGELSEFSRYLVPATNLDFYVAFRKGKRIEVIVQQARSRVLVPLQ
jgi:hypothetical protein